jgi:hypothetical protein
MSAWIIYVFVEHELFYKDVWEGLNPMLKGPVGMVAGGAMVVDGGQNAQLYGPSATPPDILSGR